MVKILLYWIGATFLTFTTPRCVAKEIVVVSKKPYKTHCNEETARVAIKLIRNQRL
jgi:hypothetical protein